MLSGSHSGTQAWECQYSDTDLVPAGLKDALRPCILQFTQLLHFLSKSWRESNGTRFPAKAWRKVIKWNFNMEAQSLGCGMALSLKPAAASF